MFWFLVSLILFVILLNTRSGRKKAEQEAYQQGYAAGYEFLHRQPSMQGQQATPEQAHQVAGPVVQHEATEVLSSGEILYPDSTKTGDSEAVRQVNDVDKERRTLKNLNSVLYVGSFLIVAAMALFVNLTMSPMLKLAGIILVALVFYVAGLVLHATSERLKPAAVAFTGTGLAILPFVGFALYSLGGLSAEIAWLLTSIAGLLAYALAAFRLQSQFISYVTMVFVLSLALSAVSTLGLAVLWYFVVIISTSLLFNVVRIFGRKYLPKVFLRPVQDAGLLTTPVALLASLFMIGSMDIWMYEVLFGLATAHYLLIWLEDRKYVYEIAVRALAHATLLIFAADIAQTLTTFGVIWLVGALAQALYSALRVRRQDERSVWREQVCTGTALTLAMLGLLFWSVVPQTFLWTSVNIVAIAVICLVAALRFRRPAWLYGVLASMLALPFVVGRLVIEPALSFEVIAGVFALFSIVALFGCDRVRVNNRSQTLLQVVAVAVVSFAITTVLSGILVESSSALGWTTLVAAGVLVGLSYVLVSPATELIGAISAVVSVASWVNMSLGQSNWLLVITVVLSTTMLLIGSALHHRFGERQRRNYLVILAAITWAWLVFVFFAMDEVVLRTATTLLLGAGLAGIIGRHLLATRETLGQVSLLGYIVYPFLALMLAMILGGGWLTLTLLVIAGIAWAASYVEKIPGVLAVGHTLFFISLLALWSWLKFDPHWTIFGVSWLASALWYLHYWFTKSMADIPRSNISFGFTVVVLLVASTYGLATGGDTTFILAGAGSLLAIAGVLGVHGYNEKNRNLIEAAIYIGTLSLQRMAVLLIPELTMVVYAHWWAGVIGLVGLWRKESSIVRPIIALSFVTLSTGLFALSGVSGYSLLFLIEHVLITVVGALLRAQWAMWWGVCATIVAVLYFLRDYTFLVLLFVGFLLILFVVWRLLKVGKKK